VYDIGYVYVSGNDFTASVSRQMYCQVPAHPGIADILWAPVLRTHVG